MKIDITLTGAANVFALIKATPGNEASTVSELTATLGAPTAGVGLPGVHNTEVMVKARDGTNLVGTTTVDYRRASLIEHVVDPELEYVLGEDETAGDLLARVATALGLREQEVEFVTDPVRPESGLTSQVTLRAIANSYVYIGSQVLDLTWPAIVVSINDDIAVKSLDGFEEE